MRSRVASGRLFTFPFKDLELDYRLIDVLLQVNLPLLEESGSVSNEYSNPSSFNLLQSRITNAKVMGYFMFYYILYQYPNLIIIPAASLDRFPEQRYLIW